ncbi:MAG: hypothetical protein KKG47_06715 [Proteobacteria bacterium]|nr:hypothetical protein [Pseudomonadota bacterium]MBU1739734.1 hypothetical protein [Pseudomonadota bacterium]
MLKQLKIYYILVSLPFILLLLGSAVFFGAIKSTIIRNPHPQINYAIFVIILAGGLFIILNAGRLIREAKILALFTKAIREKTDSTTLREMTNRFRGDLACLLQMVAASGDRAISHQEQIALGHELSNARTRLNRRNALPQYLTGLLVGMGLLGTFIGLLATLNDISVLISSFAEIDMVNANPIEVFRVMIERMKAPMQSMGIAFSASLFGLLGSIILGLMMVGIRRLEGDIFSVLSSEVAKHIENALAFESITLRSGNASRALSANDAATEILLRIDERLAEAARARQRALTSDIDDFKKQRSDMVQVLAEHAESNNNFRNELQQFGGQLEALTNVLEKNQGGVANQISDLLVNLAGDAKKTHKLQALQVNEQRKLTETLESFKIEERLAEATRTQQRALSAEMEDFKKQRADMLQVLTEHTVANNNFRVELQQFGSKLGALAGTLEKGNGELASQLSELLVHTTSDAKQSRLLMNSIGSNLRGELQQFNSVAKSIEKGNRELATRIVESMAARGGE